MHAIGFSFWFWTRNDFECDYYIDHALKVSKQCEATVNKTDQTNQILQKDT